MTTTLPVNRDDALLRDWRNNVQGCVLAQRHGFPTAWAAIGRVVELLVIECERQRKRTTEADNRSGAA